HGMIVASQSSSNFTPAPGVVNPAWLNWWPANLGQSWLLIPSGAEQSPLARMGGILWLAAGILLVAAGLAVLGIVIPAAWWRSLALAGAVISLLMLIIYLHPFFGIGIGASIVLLAALLIKQWPLLEGFGL
ncbi:MAG TPA: hypothetical protein VF338_06535, partial [Leptolinea sp.]